MELLYKPDWEETKKRYLAWWAGEALDRCMLGVRAPRKDARNIEPPKTPDDPIAQWTDLDYISRINEYVHSRTFYGGESFPVWTCGYPGHVSIPAFLGCPVTLDHETGWWDPILKEESWDMTKLKIDPNNHWWKLGLEILRRAVKECRGKSIPSIGAFGGCGDTLAALRSSMSLLYDVSERPELVRETELYLMDMWIEVYNTLFSIVNEVSEGSTCFFNLWSPGRFYCTHCDFSYMISPKMFEELFMPAIEKWAEFLDHTVYHVDGENAFAHIPLLCRVPKIQAIQVLPGDGKPSPLHYMDSLKTVQAAGKNLHIGIPPNEVEEALANLSARGLYIQTRCATEDEARDLIKKAKKWSKDRKIVI